MNTTNKTKELNNMMTEKQKLQILQNGNVTEYSERELEEQYRDMLDDVYGEIDICGYKYPASRALADIDPIAFREGFHDYTSPETVMIEDRYFNKDEADMLL